jgi:hypothetical protein
MSSAAGDREKSGEVREFYEQAASGQLPDSYNFVRCEGPADDCVRVLLTAGPAALD